MTHAILRANRSEIETVIENYLAIKNASVADSLMATSRVYTLFQNIMSEDAQAAESESEEKGEYAYEDKNSHESVLENQVKREQKPKNAQDIKDLFNAWNNLDDDDSEPDDLQGAEAWTHNEMPEQPLEAGDLAFSYDDGQRIERLPRRLESCIEKKFVKATEILSSWRAPLSRRDFFARHQFQLIARKSDAHQPRNCGEDYDLNALVDYVIDRKADGRQSEISHETPAETARRCRFDSARPIFFDGADDYAQSAPAYTHPGRRIYRIEKEAWF